jgi:hypothetical protein
MAASVRAFQPRRYDPPRFVAETGDDLKDLEGSFIGAGQCDNCGNSTYHVESRVLARGTLQYVAVCKVDPDDDPEFAWGTSCGTEWRITIWDEDLVEF